MGGASRDNLLMCGRDDRALRVDVRVFGSDTFLDPAEFVESLQLRASFLADAWRSGVPTSVI
jgi:hypothetical protein